MMKQIITEKTGIIDNSLIRPHPLNCELYNFKEDDRTDLEKDMLESVSYTHLTLPTSHNV